MKKMNMKAKKKFGDTWKKVLCMLLIISIAFPTNLVSFAAGEESVVAEQGTEEPGGNLEPPSDDNGQGSDVIVPPTEEPDNNTSGGQAEGSQSEGSQGTEGGTSNPSANDTVDSNDEGDGSSNPSDDSNSPQPGNDSFTDNTGSEEPALSPVPTPDEAPAPPADVTGNKEQVQLSISQVWYTPKEGQRVTLSGTESYDLTVAVAEEIASFGMEFAVQLPQSGEERSVKAGDFITVDLHNALLTAEETTEPVDTDSGSYEIKNQILKFTFNESGAGTDANARITVPVAFGFDGEKLSEKDNTVIDFTLQQDNKVSLTFGKKASAKPDQPDGEETEPSVSPKLTISPEASVTPEPTINPEAEVSPVPSVTPSVTPGEENDADGTPGQDDSSALRNQMQSVLLTLFGNVSLLQALKAGTATDYNGNHYTWTYEHDKDNLPDGFLKIKLDVFNQKGGITTESSTSKVKLQFNVNIDDDYMFKVCKPFWSDPTFPGNGSVSEVETWMKANNIQGLSYTKKLGDIFEGDDIQDPEQVGSRDNPIAIKPASFDVALGTYYISNGTLYFNVNPICYFLDSVSMKFNFELAVSEELINENEPGDVTVNNGELILETIGSVEEGNDPLDNTNYSISKMAVDENGNEIEQTDKNHIKYKIEVAATEGHNLNGATLTETIPEGMKVTDCSAELKYQNTKDSETETGTDTLGSKELGWVKEPAEGNKKTYTFPENGNKIYTSAVFYVTAELDDDTYQKVIDSHGINQSFVNKAVLSGKDDGKDYQKTVETTTDMKFNFLNKKGSNANVEGTRFAWTVEVNSNLHNLSYGYVVDTIDWTAHTYDLYSVTLNNETVKDISNYGNISKWYKNKSGNDIPEEVLENLKWGNDLTAKKLHEALKSIDITDIDNGIIYLYDSDTPNPFVDSDENEPTMSQKAMLILPYNYKGDNHYELKYCTDLNMHGLTADAYTAVNYKPTIDNKVNVIWEKENPDGPGPGSYISDTLSFNKGVETYVEPVKKTGFSYVESTHKLTWKILVNALGNKLTQPELTDTLQAGTYENLSVVCKWIESEGTKGTETTGDCDSLEEYPNEAIKDPHQYAWKIEGDNLKIKLPDTQFKEEGYTFYTIEVSMTLTDPSILSVHGDNTGKNKVRLDAVVDDEPKYWESEADINIPNTLIQKASVGQYDYKNDTFTWKITVNPNHVIIRDAAITDQLYETDNDKKNVWGAADKAELKAVEIISADSKNSASTPADVEDYSITPNANNDEITIKGKSGTNINIGTDTCIFTLSTKVTPEWKKENLRTDGTAKPLPVKNTAILNGEVANKLEGTNVKTKTIENATASAVNTVTVEPAKKSGKYNPDDGSIAWTVEVNKYGYNLKDCKLIEDLTEGKSDTPLIHSLDVDTVKVYKMDSDSNYPDTAIATSENNPEKFGDLSVKGFNYLFTTKEATDTSTYKFVFTTYITEAGSVSGAKITNKIYINDENGNLHDSTNSSDGGYDGNYDFDKGATGSLRPKFKLVKYSKNSVDNVEKRYPLGGAEFTLKAYEYTVEGDTIKIGPSVSRYDNYGSTTKDGEITFWNLKSKINETTNLIYVLEESVPPAGYKKDTTPRFIGFEGQDIQDTGSVVYNGNTYQYSNNQDNVALMLLSTESEKNMNKAPAEFLIVNEPQDITNNPESKVQVSGLDSNGDKIYSNAGAGVIFKIEASEGGKDKLKTRYITTDAKGQFKFSDLTPDLDPGTYTMTEIYSPTQAMDVGGKLTLTVTAGNEKNGYSLAVASQNSNYGLSYNNGIIKNNLLKTDITLDKKIGYQDGNQEKNTTVESNVQNMGSAVEFTLTWDDTAMDGKTKYFESETATTGSNGKVTFENIPAGIYTLTETRPDGYKIPKVYTVTVTAEASDTVLDSTYAGGPYKGRRLKVEINEKNTINIITNNTISNTPIKGKISFDKVLIDDVFSNCSQNDVLVEDSAKIAGVEFGLFRKIGELTATNPLYIATSDAQGNVCFGSDDNQDNPMVEFGDYVLKELKVPDGIELSTNEIPITRAELKATLTTDKNSFDYKVNKNDENQNGQIGNKLLKRNISITKKDMDGNLLVNRKFSLWRRGSNEIKDGSSPVTIKPDDNIKTYFKYVLGANTDDYFITDENGNIVINNLPYGDYLLIENEDGLDLQDSKAGNAVFIKVGTEDVKYYHEVGFEFNEKYNSQSGSITSDLPENTENSKWLSVTANNMDTCSFEITNYLKYAYIQLNKAVGEKKGDSLEEYRDDNGNIKPVAGAEFSIYKVGESDTTIANGATPYLKLVTGTDGKLQVPVQESDNESHDGAYTQGDNYVHLLYGYYIIKETTPPTGFSIADSKEYKFKVDDKTTGMQGTVWLMPNKGESDDNPAGISYSQKNGEEPQPKDYVYNTLNRGTITLKKSATDNKANTNFKGAEFVVKTTDKKTVEVASLKETVDKDNNVTYKLSNQKNGNGSYNEVNSAGYRYLYQTADGEPWRLLSGEYTIEETKAPAGYKVAAPFTVTIEDDSTGDVKLVEGNSTGSNVVTIKNNVITLEDAPIQITLKKEGVNAAPLNDVEFKVTGIFKGETSKQTKAFTTKDNGETDSITILVAGNQYTITETVPADGYKVVDSFEIEVQADGTVKFVNKDSVECKLDYAKLDYSKTQITVTDKQNNVSIVKKDLNGTVLSGAKFEVSGDFTGGTETIEITTSDTLSTALQGKLKATPDLEHMTEYTLKEIKAPVGYKLPIGKELTFYVDINGKVHINSNSLDIEKETNLTESITVKDEPIVIKLQKQDESGSPLKGAVFKVSGSFKDGENTKTWNTAANDTPKDQFVGGETYTFEETQAPAGYYLAQPFKIKVNEDGTIALNGDSVNRNHVNINSKEASITVKDSQIELGFEKKDSNDNSKVIEDGYEFTLEGVQEDVKYFADEKIHSLTITETITEKNKITGLKVTTNPNGTEGIDKFTYKLSEVKAPAGYKKFKTAAVFTVNQYGGIDFTENSAGKVTANQKDGMVTISAENNPIAVELVKLSTNDGNRLNGATFSITGINENNINFADGDKTKKWIGNTIMTGLLANTRYIVTETEAPKGYTTIDEPIMFTIDEYGDLKTTLRTSRIASNVVDFDPYKNIITVRNGETQAMIIKKDADTDIAINSGTIFTIYGPFMVNGIETNQQIEVNSNQALIKTLIENRTYTLKEKTAPNGYELQEGEVEFTLKKGCISIIKNDNKIASLSDDGLNLYFKDEPIEISLEKRDSKGNPLKDVEFELSSDDDSNYKSPVTITTDKDGKIHFGQGAAKHSLIQDVNYTLTETKSYNDYYWPKGKAPSVDFKVNKDGTLGFIGKNYEDTIFNLNSNGDGIIVTNQNMNAAVEFYKVDADTQEGMEGVEFSLEYTATDGQCLGDVPKYSEMTYTTDQNGHLKIENLIKGHYTLKEKSTLPGYILGTSPFTVEFDITNGDHGETLKLSDLVKTQEATLLEGNKLKNKPTRLDINKTDEEGKPLPGAEFSLTPAKGSEFADKTRTPYVATVGDKGVESIKNILAPENSYIIKETTAPAGYITAPEFVIHYDTDGKVSLESENNGIVTVDNDSISIRVKNSPNNITLVKTDMSGKALDKGVFKITGKFVRTQGDEIIVDLSDKVAADARLKGEFYATTNNAESDKYVYTVEEIKAPDGYEIPSEGSDPIQFTVDSQGILHIAPDSSKMAEVKDKTVLTIKDKKLEIDLEKRGNDQDDTVLTGAEFDVTGTFVGGTGEETIKWTDTTKDKLRNKFIGGNTYTFHETTAPDGYELVDRGIEVTVDKYGNLSVIDKDGPLTVDKDNPEKLIFTDEPIEIKLKKITYVGETALPLKNIEFSLTGEDDKRYPPDKEPITTVKTDDNGVYLFAQNPNDRVGFRQGCTYTLTEISKYDDLSPEKPSVTFTVNNDGTVTFKKESYNQDLISLVDDDTTIQVVNRKVCAGLKLDKIDSVSKAGISGVEFLLEYKGIDGVYDKEENYAHGSYRTNSDGQLMIGGLIKGTYTITEKKPAAGYSMGSEPFEATFTVNDSNYNKILTMDDLKVTKGKSHVDKDGKITNDRLSGSASITKTGSDGKTPLKGVVFTLYTSSGTKLGDYTTDDKGQIYISGLSWDNYYLQETKPLPGYLPNDKKYEFGISAASLSASLGTVKNSPSKVSLQKVGAEGKALEGVEFTITGKFADGSSTYKWTTDGKALDLEGILQPGEKYTVTEVKAASGYVKLDAPVEFTVGSDSKLTLNAAAKDAAAVKDNGLSLVITNVQTVAEITKVDESGNPLSGAELAVKDADGKVLATWVSEEIAHTITGVLNPGETYTLSETKAPDGYQLAQDIKFTVPADGKVSVSMTDKKVPDEKGSGSVTVTKTVYYGDEPLAIDGLSFYAVLFSDEALTNRVTEVKELAFSGSFNTTVTFDNLPMGTYYVAETDGEGNIYDGAELGMTVEITNQVCTLTKSSPHSSSVIRNVLPEPPDGYYIKPDGTLTVTKKIVYKDKAVSVKDETFYVALFADADFLEIAYGPAEINVKGASSGTAVFDKVAMGTYYLAETDENGVPVDPEDENFAYRPSLSSDIVTIEQQEQKEEITLTNRIKYMKEPSVTPVPGKVTGTGGTVTSARETTHRTPTKTGDETNAMPYVFLLLAGAFTILTAARRRRRK